VLHAIGDLGFEVFLLAVVLSGAFQILFGLLRAGVLGYFFPFSVIRGMLAGIGIIIILKQIPHALGYDSNPEGDLQFLQPDGETTLSALARMLDGIEPNAVLVAGVSLAILILWERVLAHRARIFRLVQGPVVAVAFGIVYQSVTSRVAPNLALGAEHLVSVPVHEGLSGFLELFTTPAWSHIVNPAVWITAITIAIVGSLETLLCLDATDKLDPQKRVTPANRELIAQGTGNLLSGAIGGLPITQVIVRSSANIQSGARTKASAILHGGYILVFVVALPHLLNLVPLAVLASILFVVGYKLAQPSLFKTMRSLGWAQFTPFVVTIAGIVFTDLLMGIALGMVVAIVIILQRNYLNSHFLHIEESDTATRHSVRLTLSEEVTFLNKGAILRELSKIPDGSRVTIDVSSCFAMDYDVSEVIEDFKASAAGRDITVEVAGKPRNGEHWLRAG